jgi:hypothetical protein
VCRRRRRRSLILFVSPPRILNQEIRIQGGATYKVNICVITYEISRALFHRESNALGNNKINMGHYAISPPATLSNTGNGDFPAHIKCALLACEMKILTLLRPTFEQHVAL